MSQCRMVRIMVADGPNDPYRDSFFFGTPSPKQVSPEESLQSLVDAFEQRLGQKKA